ncbi:hypothetical protein BG74_04645 [Sodalis-like endosymbiont of Proechinophthirus fluctus]|nr:hypothetical protein BG74_04645 [Sodalis-like endosymbiont of Proechinophthirus fluctus]
MLAAQQQSLQTMSGYHEQAQKRYSPEMAKIYKAYRLMLQDEVYLDNIKQHNIKQHIDTGQWSDRDIILETECLCCSLSKQKSAYLAQPVEDIPCATIEELTPADIQSIARAVKGFVTRSGGITPHSVILANRVRYPGDCLRRDRSR